jgi:aspartate aminotransferase-like enzyme
VNLHIPDPTPLLDFNGNNSAKLRIPGPTPLPGPVLEAIGQQMISHRGEEFSGLFRRLTGNLQTCFQTRGDVLILTGSGTGGLEAAIANLVSPGDPVLSVVTGVFGERWARIAEAFGAQVTRLEFPLGRAADLEAVVAALHDGTGYRLVLVTHNETSTGVTNDVAAVAQAVHSLGRERPVLAVDAISSLGAIDLPVDALGLDVVVTASQKAWMAPPGVAAVSVSPYAWAAVKRARAPRFYWDFQQAKRYAEKGQTPATPAVSVLYGLDRALELILDEGLPNVFTRHERLARYLRQELRSLGFGLLAPDECASNTLTAVEVPGGMGAAELINDLRLKHKIVVAGGQGPLAGKILRIAHMGYVTQRHLDELLDALRQVLPLPVACPQP